MSNSTINNALIETRDSALVAKFVEEYRQEITILTGATIKRYVKSNMTKESERFTKAQMIRLGRKLARFSIEGLVNFRILNLMMAAVAMKYEGTPQEGIELRDIGLNKEGMLCIMTNKADIVLSIIPDETGSNATLWVKKDYEGKLGLVIPIRFTKAFMMANSSKVA